MAWGGIADDPLASGEQAWTRPRVWAAPLTQAISFGIPQDDTVHSRSRPLGRIHRCARRALDNARDPAAHAETWGDLDQSTPAVASFSLRGNGTTMTARCAGIRPGKRPVAGGPVYPIRIRRCLRSPQRRNRKVSSKIVRWRAQLKAPRWPHMRP